MKQNLYVASGEGRRFTFRADTITIQASGVDTMDGAMDEARTKYGTVYELP